MGFHPIDAELSTSSKGDQEKWRIDGNKWGKQNARGNERLSRNISFSHICIFNSLIDLNMKAHPLWIRRI